MIRKKTKHLCNLIDKETKCDMIYVENLQKKSYSIVWWNANEDGSALGEEICR